MKRNLIPIVLSNLIVMIVLMVTIYIHVGIVTNLEQKYSMSRDHKVFEKGETQVSFFDVFDPEVDQNVLVLSEYNNENYLGVYDPMMIYAGQNSYQIKGMTRYFNTSDYMNQTNTGIFLSSYDNFNQCKLWGEKLMDIVLYCAENSDTFGENITHLLNLSSLEALGDTVYIDYDDLETVKPLIEKMKSLGYQEILARDYGFVEIFLKVELGLLLIYILILSGMYILYFMMLYWHFLNERKRIYLHYLHGGSHLPILLSYVKPYLKGNAYGLVLIYVLKEILNLIEFVRFSNGSFLMLLILHNLITVLLLMVSFSKVYNKITMSYEEIDYVY